MVWKLPKQLLITALNILKLKHIIAKALPENIASWKIMEKCGMQYCGEVMEYDLLLKKYGLGNGNRE